MSSQRNMKNRQELLDDIKKYGQSIIDNAESILGDERYFMDLKISFIVDRSLEKGLTINLERHFIPEGDIEK